MDRIKIGDIELIAVTDGAAPPVSPSWPFPEVPENDWNSHRYALDSDGLHTSNFGCFVIRDKEATILVDTGMGSHPPERFGQPPALLPGSLLAAGVKPTDVTKVVFTHLHFDHVGWAFSKDRVYPFFPNARYVASRTDWEYWNTSTDDSRADHLKSFEFNVEPLSGLGVIDLVEGEQFLSGGIRTLPTPGHTPGHMSLFLESNGKKGVVTGDVFHSSAQFTNPDWSHRADVDPALGRKTRKQLLERFLDGMTIACGHLEHGSNIGTVAMVDENRYWRGF